MYVRAPVIGLVLLGTACGAANDDTHAGRSQMAMPKATGVEVRSCGSDLTCPLGSVCAKKAGAFTGECLRAVDENGAPVSVPHSVDSYGAGPLTCTTTSDCPSRFRCDEGRCV